MLSASKMSPISQQLKEILLNLNQNHFVENAVLSTEDGLAVAYVTSETVQLAAVTGFLLAAGQQSCAMLGLQNNTEILLQQEEGTFIVCYPFALGTSHLVLTCIFKKNIAYKQLLKKVIQQIQQVAEG